MTENEIKWNLDGVIKYLCKKNEFGGDENEKQYQVDNTTLDLLEELQQYREIGTVEECREARDRQIHKRYKKIHPCKSVTYYQCPFCNGLLHINENFCGECGQAIDWSDTP